MKIHETGLVLKEVKLREADRILTLLTQKHGIVSVSAKGSMRPKSKLFSACGLYSYSEWTLYEGKTMYSVNEASPIEVFFGLRQRLESVALASYIAELLQIFSPTGTEAAKLLRLSLNSFYLLSENKRDASLVKMVFELRSLAEIGFMPNITMCDDCGRYEGGPFYFSASSGALLCGGCAGKKEFVPNLSEGALAALRHIVLVDDDKLFSFTLSGESLLQLSRLSEQYLLANVNYAPSSLGFLKSVL